jgi:hypothetical protein
MSNPMPILFPAAAAAVIVTVLMMMHQDTPFQIASLLV